MLGFSPQQVDAMSMWQFMAAVEGYAEAQNPKKQDRLSTEDKDELAAWLGIDGAP